MARKDNIFKSFLEHDLIQKKYHLSQGKLPDSVRDGLKSELPIVKSLALIVESLENVTPITDKELHRTITLLLNSIAL
jgi:hypothetical protein